MNVRDRVQELRRVPARELTPHPKNWRRHPRRQRAGLQSILSEVGYADAVVARELPDGRLQLIDGHLRAETTPDALIPVLVVELNDDEAEKVLLTHDALAEFAEVDAAALASLLHDVDQESQGIEDLLSEIETLYRQELKVDPPNLREVAIPETYQVVVNCRDEQDQQAVYEQMRKEGRQCRVLTL